MGNTSTHRKIFIIIIGISLAGALVLLGLLFDWRLTKPVPTGSDVTSNQTTPSRDYSGLDERAVAQALKDDTGLDIVTLQNKPISKSTFTSEQKAVDAARALLAIGRADKALEVYQLIEKEYPNSPKSAEFYDGAAIAADQTGNIELGTSYLKKERAQVANNKSLSEEARKDTLDKLDAKLGLRGGAV